MMAGRHDPGQHCHRDGHGGPDGQDLCQGVLLGVCRGLDVAPAATVCLSCPSASRGSGFSTSAAGLEIAASSTPHG